MIAKARVAQLTGLPSITAAAEGPVTFGCFFYRWKARLLSGWGSSLAQGTGGRVRAPAPTAYPKVRLIFCRARCPIGPFSGGPVCRPYEIWETFRSFRRGRSQTGPRAAKGRPYGGNGPVALARQSQAQFLNRSNSTFCTPRAQWPGGNSDQPLRFCAPEGLHSSKG